MRRNITPRAVLLLSVGLIIPLAACGDDSVAPAASQGDSLPPVPTTAPTPTTEAPAGGYAHPTGADDIVIEVTYEGGFAPVEAIFTQLPSVLVSGDGRQFTPGAMTMIYPGPLVLPIQVGDIGEDGVQELLALADKYGLLQDREYEAPTNIADAPDTVVTIRTNDATYVHRAYALGIDMGLDGTQSTEVSDDPRAQLQSFVDAATATTDPAAQGYVPESYLVRATPVADLSVYDPEPTVVAWPLEIDLATAAECLEIPAVDIADTLTDANQLTFFEQAGTAFQLAVKPLLPGDGC